MLVSSIPTGYCQEVGSEQPLAIVLEALPKLLEQVRATSFDVIAIDGYSGVGKTTLAQSVADALGARCLSLDNFIEPLQQVFVDALDSASLSRALRARPVIIEGVCMLAALDRVSLKPSLLIYVKGSGT
jgi:replication-associated recombination protein RarA